MMWTQLYGNPMKAGNDSREDTAGASVRVACVVKGV